VARGRFSIAREMAAARPTVQCRVCQLDISPERRLGRPRLICTMCDLEKIALSILPRDPQPCERCGFDFRPVRMTDRFCSADCRQAATRERRRTYTECQGCGKPLSGPGRKYCSPACRQRTRNALRRQSELRSCLTCPECRMPFEPRRAGVIYCSSFCARRHAGRVYSARQRQTT
jgi:hypothetical protein